MEAHRDPGGIQESTEGEAIRRRTAWTRRQMKRRIAIALAAAVVVVLVAIAHVVRYEVVESHMAESRPYVVLWDRWRHRLCHEVIDAAVPMKFHRVCY